jgi:hypothetical protein
MTDQTISADIIPMRKAPMTGAERQRACRARKAAAKAGTKDPAPTTKTTPVKAVTAIAPDRPAVTPVTRVTTVTAVTPITPVTLSRVTVPSPLTLAAFGLGTVGFVMNGWFARSLGSSDAAGWLFLAVGVASDVVALAIPSASSAAWSAQQRGAALAGWLVFAATFIFAVTAGIGFASINVTDVTLSRASRVTPAVTAAKTALDDAMASRDRECKGGVGSSAGSAKPP